MSRRFVPLKSVADLQRGDIVRHRGPGPKAGVVDAVYGDRATAVSTVDITNAIEWEVLRASRWAVSWTPASGHPARAPARTFSSLDEAMLTVRDFYEGKEVVFKLNIADAYEVRCNGAIVAFLITDDE